MFSSPTGLQFVVNLFLRRCWRRGWCRGRGCCGYDGAGDGWLVDELGLADLDPAQRVDVLGVLVDLGGDLAGYNLVDEVCEAELGAPLGDHDEHDLADAFDLAGAGPLDC